MQVSSNHIILLVFFATAIFLLAGCFLLLYIDLYNKRKKKHLEEKQILKKQYEEELIKTQMEVQEQTLQTIASDIHDNIGQLLSITKLTLSTVDVGKHPVRAQEKVNNSLELINTSIKELRELSSVLHAQNLLEKGLENAIQNEIKWLSKSDQFKITWEVSGERPEKSNAQHELIAFRLIQELMNNIIKHARASEIIVRYVYKPDLIVITIEDNGIGFDVQRFINNPVGLGLNSLFNRAKMIGGELTLISEEGRGTKASLQLIY
jgi:two-component system, NarL family, sensor kinase